MEGEELLLIRRNMWVCFA